MATHTQTVAKWKSIMRRLYGRQVPYWRKRLEDEQEPAPMLAAGQQVAFQVLFAVVLAMLVLLPAAYLSVIVFVVPGGLPQVIGSQLADVCRSSGHCNFGELMAGYAFAVNFIIVAAAFLVITIGRVTTAETASTHEQDLAFIDARIVALRDELIASGILTVPAEERKDET